MVYFNVGDRVTLIEGERPNRHCEVCGETPAGLSVIMWEPGFEGKPVARAARRSHYFCHAHRGEAEKRLELLRLIARAEDAALALQGRPAKFREWCLSLGDAERAVFRQIRDNTLIVRTREDGEPVHFQRANPLFSDMYDLSDELQAMLSEVGYPAWEKEDLKRRKNAPAGSSDT